MRNRALHRPIASPLFFCRRSLDKIEAWGEAARSFGHRINGASASADGVFASWTWNGETLTVQNDRYGFFPLFYYVKDFEFGVSTNVSTLVAAGADAELNDAGIALYLRLGNFIGDDTPFRHIRCIPPNTTLVWDRNGVRLNGGYVAMSEEKSIARRDAVHRYIELFA